MSAISLTSALKTTKVANDAGSVAQGFRLFVSNIENDIPNYLVDPYGRPCPIDGCLQWKGKGAAGALSPLWIIENQNMLNPQYSQYLNVPQGLQMTQNEYPNRPHTDLLGVNRDRAFQMNGSYDRMPYPSSNTNPGSDADFLLQQQWNANQLLTKFDNRQWGKPGDLSSGF